MVCTDSLMVSCGYDLDVNIWNMNTYQLKNCFKVCISFFSVCSASVHYNIDHSQPLRATQTGYKMPPSVKTRNG